MAETTTIQNSTDAAFADASKREERKTALQKAQDVSYTINHALTCTAVDLLQVPLVAWLQNKFDGRSGKLPWEKVSRAEVIGDVGAVPLTIAFQRFAPGAMAGIGKALDPLFGDLFRSGARSNANRWAIKHGYSPDSKEAIEKAREIYAHEASHLGQAAVWTASSFALNVLTQAAEERLTGKTGHTSWKSLIAGKGIGSLTSSIALVTLRGLSPATAEKWDGWTSEKIFMPATKTVSGWFGVSNKEFEDFKKQSEKLEADNHKPHHHEKQHNKEMPAHTVQELGSHSLLTPQQALHVS